MEIKQYLIDVFPNDVKKMNFLHVPEECLKCLSLRKCDKGIDENTVYFGGQNWENFYQDISKIDKENLEHFFICLFTIVLIDISVYTYYQKYYHKFREKTMFPKFGGYRSGFGISPYYVNPKNCYKFPNHII